MENVCLFRKIKQLSNEKKFSIIEKTQKHQLDVSTLSKEVKIAFNKCSNYCTALEKEGLIQKQKEGKRILVLSKVHFKENTIIFK
ncbi:MAG: winged helix-turn-helix domain-containing protein [archaeon]